MKWFATLALVMALQINTRAASPDDRYVEIYNEIVLADNAQQNGNSKDAAEKYTHAQRALVVLQKDHPLWNHTLVAYRLEYVNQKLGSVPVSEAKAAAAAAVAPVEPSVASTARLQEQIASLKSANEELQKKLKETTSTRPAAVDPHELQKAEDEVVVLKKECELLNAALSKGQPAATAPVEAPNPAPSTSGADAEIAKLKLDAQALEKRLAAANDEISQLKSAPSTAASPDKKMKRQLDAANKKLAAAKAKADAEMQAKTVVEEKLRQVEQQRDELQTKQATAAPTVSTSSDSAPSQEVEQLRARVAVLEAAKVPYTADELAVLNSAPIQALPMTAVQPSGRVHSVKDLPPGTGLLMAEAQRASMQHDYATAIVKYNEVLSQDASNVYVLAHLANAQFASAHLEDCEKTVQRALALDPQDPGTLYLLGVLRYREEKLDEALDALSRSAKLNPTNAGTENYLGCVLCDKGLRPAAETALRTALRLDPEYADAHYNLAFVYAMETPPSITLARWHYHKAVDLGHAKNSALEKTMAQEK